jgi:hypothetical protein
VLARAFARNLQALRISWGQHVARAAATRAAENGAAAHELMAIVGWVDIKEAEIYTRAANRQRLAAQAMPSSNSEYSICPPCCSVSTPGRKTQQNQLQISGLVRSEGGRICRDINGLSELGNEQGAFQAYGVPFS